MISTPSAPFARSVLDLETLGTTPGSMVLSIGMTWARVNEPASLLSFYVVIPRKASRDLGLTSDSSTLEWWGNPKLDTAWKNCNPAWTNPDDIARDWEDAFQRLSNWLRSFPQPPAEVWANPAHFDFPILAEISRRIQHPLPWDGRAQRCLRTMRKYHPQVPWPENPHHAMADAINQHRWLDAAIPTILP